MADGREESIGKITRARKIGTVGEVNDFDLGGDGGGFGFLGEIDERRVGLGKVEVGDERGGRAENARDFECGGYKRGEAKSGVFWGVFLVVSGFMGFVDDDEAEIFERGKESGARTNDDLRGVGVEKLFPDKVTFGFSLARVE